MNEDQKPRRISPKQKFKIVEIAKKQKVGIGKFSAFSREELGIAFECALHENAKLILERKELKAKIRAVSIAPDEVEIAIDQMILFLLPEGEPADKSIIDFTGMAPHEILALLVKHKIFELEASLREAKGKGEQP